MKPPRLIRVEPALSKWGHYRRAAMVRLRILLGASLLLYLILAVAFQHRLDPFDALAIGATAPSFIQEAETAWNSSTTPKTTASFSVQTGDVLVALAVNEDFDFFGGSNPLSISGGGLTWTQQQAVTTADYTAAYCWTTTATSNTSLTATFSQTGSGGWFGGNVLTFRGSDGVGASNKANAATGDSSVAVTNIGDNSALVAAMGDWNAVDGATRVWRTINSVTPASGSGEVTYFRDSSHYTVYGAYWSDCGAAGSKTAGMTDPNGMKWAIVAVEVKGTAGAATKARPPHRRSTRFFTGRF